MSSHSGVYQYSLLVVSKCFFLDKNNFFPRHLYFLFPLLSSAAGLCLKIVSLDSTKIGFFYTVKILRPGPLPTNPTPTLAIENQVFLAHWIVGDQLVSSLVWGLVPAHTFYMAP